MCRCADRSTDPCYPRPVGFAERSLPRRFKRLKELIGLKKGAKGQGIEETEGEEEEEDVRGGHSRCA